MRPDPAAEMEYFEVEDKFKRFRCKEEQGSVAAGVYNITLDVATDKDYDDWQVFTATLVVKGTFLS